ncbi:MAG: hypothetical protein ABF719_01425, partial [Acetobacter sp.]
MSKKSFRQAINEALRQEMQRDPRVILMGEDIAGGQGGSAGVVDAWGGVLGVTKGLYTEFGAERVFDTPISEASYIGAAVGAGGGGGGGGGAGGGGGGWWGVVWGGGPAKLCTHAQNTC